MEAINHVQRYNECTCYTLGTYNLTSESNPVHAACEHHVVSNKMHFVILSLYKAC